MNVIEQSAAYKKGEADAASQTLRDLIDLVPEAVECAKEVTDGVLDGDVEAKIKAIIQQVPEGRARRKIIHKMRRMLDQRRHQIETEYADTVKTRDHLRSAVDAGEKIQEWLSGPLNMQRPVETLIHSFRQALAEGRIFDLPSRTATVPDQDIPLWDEMAEQASVFMVRDDRRLPGALPCMVELVRRADNLRGGDLGIQSDRDGLDLFSGHFDHFVIA